MSADHAERLTNARDVLVTLFPDETVFDLGAGSSTRADRRRQFAVVPSRKHPRLLIPLHPHAAGGAALRAYGGRLSTIDRVSYRSLAAALGATGGRGLRPRLAVSAQGGSPGIDDHLGDVVGVPVSIAVHLTPARANRKPIVQALAEGQRRPVAFAKLATNSLTADLVKSEAEALSLLADCELGSVVVPELLDARSFNGHETLVMRPLPTWSRGRLPNPAELERATADIAATAPGATDPLTESTFWKRLRTTIQRVTPAPRRDALERTADRLDSSAGAMDVDFGASHGDWSPWNMWLTRDGLLVWDWERFATDVPLGSDLVHYRLQELILMKGAPRIDAARSVLESAASRLVAALHLFALAVRYDSDDQTGAGGRILPSDEWLLPVVDEATRDLRTAAGHRT